MVRSHLRHLRGLREEAGENVRLLMILTGVSHFGALLLVSEIGDVRLFPSARHLVSCAGLCPSLHQSGETTRRGRMEKGTKHVRWMMGQAANSASVNDPEMGSLYPRRR